MKEKIKTELPSFKLEPLDEDLNVLGPFIRDIQNLTNPDEVKYSNSKLFLYIYIIIANDVDRKLAFGHLRDNDYDVKINSSSVLVVTLGKYIRYSKNTKYCSFSYKEIIE